MPWIPLVGITLVLGVLLAGAVSFLWEIGLQLGIAEGWPETTFIYEYEQASGGDRKFITRYRLTYYGRNDWFEEVLPSEPVVLPHGTFPQPRSTRRMEGRVYTEHDLDTGLTKTEVIGENTTFSPSGWFLPFPFALREVDLGGSPRRVQTDARVCFRAREIPDNVAGMACRNNAPAWRFDGRHGHHMFLDDRRGIPMGGSSFKRLRSGLRTIRSRWSGVCPERFRKCRRTGGEGPLSGGFSSSSDPRAFGVKSVRKKHWSSNRCRGYSGGTQGDMEQMNRDEFAEIRRQAREQAGWGFVSRYGRTGRIRSIQDDEKTVQIDTPHGPMLARVGAGTAIQIATAGEARVLAFEDLAPGMLVTVDGKTGTPENAAAGEIEVVPEGEGGFDIQPATGGGSMLAPLLP